MDVEELKKAQEDLKMIEALGLPATESQRKTLFELEKAFLDENVLPQILDDLKPLVHDLKNSFQIILNYSEKEGLRVEEIHNVDDALKGQTLEDQANSGRFLGIDPKTGKRIYVKVTNYGLVAQIGDENSTERPSYLRMGRGLGLNDVSLDDVLLLNEFPQKLGIYEGYDIVVGIGPFGPYIKHNKTYFNLPKALDPRSIKYEQAKKIIEDKRKSGVGNIIAAFENDPDLLVINGRFGPFIKYHKENYKIPKNYSPSLLSYEDCFAIVSDPSNKAQKWVPRNKQE